MTERPLLVELVKDAPTLKDAFYALKGYGISVLDLAKYKTSSFQIIEPHDDYSVISGGIIALGYNEQPELLLHPHGTQVAYKVNLKGRS